jgi:hypothetical protein
MPETPGPLVNTLEIVKAGLVDNIVLSRPLEVTGSGNGVPPQPLIPGPGVFQLSNRPNSCSSSILSVDPPSSRTASTVESRSSTVN